MSEGSVAVEKPIIWTLDWVPAGEGSPRGYVRDLRLRWACEEAGLDYEVRIVDFGEKGTGHLARQPFGQVPFLEDGEIVIFESGAGLLHLGRKSEALMPRDPKGEAEVTQWVVSALNSVEMVTVPWWFIGAQEMEDNPLRGWMGQRLDGLEEVLSGREWLAAGRFTIADLLMADVLRIPEVLEELAEYPALRAYVERVLARPAFQKARADQIAHFEASDAARGEGSEVGGS